jgi:hypothetical protein
LNEIYKGLYENRREQTRSFFEKQNQSCISFIKGGINIELKTAVGRDHQRDANPILKAYKYIVSCVYKNMI